MDEEEKYVIAPKGIFALALLKTHLVDNVMDWKVDAAWEIFELMMRERGYIEEREE